MHKITKTPIPSEEVTKDMTSKEILFKFLTGLFKENDLPAPKNLMRCFSDRTADEFVEYLDSFFDAVDFTNLKEVLHFLKVLVDGRGQMPPETVECIKSTKEWGDLRLKYGINEHTKMTYYYAHALKFTVTHLKEVKHGLYPIANEWE